MTAGVTHRRAESLPAAAATCHISAAGMSHCVQRGLGVGADCGARWSPREWQKRECRGLSPPHDELHSPAQVRKRTLRARELCGGDKGSVAARVYRARQGFHQRCSRCFPRRCRRGWPRRGPTPRSALRLQGREGAPRRWQREGEAVTSSRLPQGWSRRLKLKDAQILNLCLTGSALRPGSRSRRRSPAPRGTLTGKVTRETRESPHVTLKTAVLQATHRPHQEPERMAPGVGGAGEDQRRVVSVLKVLRGRGNDRMPNDPGYARDARGTSARTGGQFGLRTEAFKADVGAPCGGGGGVREQQRESPPGPVLCASVSWAGRDASPRGRGESPGWRPGRRGTDKGHQRAPLGCAAVDTCVRFLWRRGSRTGTSGDTGMGRRGGGPTAQTAWTAPVSKTEAT